MILLLYLYFCLSDYKVFPRSWRRCDSQYWPLTHACNGLGKTLMASETKLTFFHHKRGKEQADSPNRGTAPPFRCWNNTGDKPKGNRSHLEDPSAENLLWDCSYEGDEAFLYTVWIDGTGKRLAQALGRRGCWRSSKLLPTLRRALPKPSYLWCQQTPQKRMGMQDSSEEAAVTGESLGKKESWVHEQHPYLGGLFEKALCFNNSTEE